MASPIPFPKPTLLVTFQSSHLACIYMPIRLLVTTESIPMMPMWVFTHPSLTVPGGLELISSTTSFKSRSRRSSSSINRFLLRCSTTFLPTRFLGISGPRFKIELGVVLIQRNEVAILSWRQRKRDQRVVKN